MFLFDSFHMYGIIGSAVVLGSIVIYLIKKKETKNINGSKITLKNKERGIIRYLAGGTIFGLGWALTGACPGSIYILIGNGVSVFVVVLFSGLLGAFAYGLVRKRLPH